jgi:uncharacterized protein YqgC (DUF456 family)
VDGFLTGLGNVGLWTLTVVWAAAMAAGCLAALLSVPGGWIALGLAVLYDLGFGFQAVGAARLIVFAVLLGIGEAVEAALGTVYVAARGATKWGVVGALVGGILGAVAGSAVLPFVGTLIGSIVGAFAGAVAGEYFRERRLESSVQVGFHAMVGRLGAVTVKTALAFAGAWISAAAAFSHLAARGADS